MPSSLSKKDRSPTLFCLMFLNNQLAQGDVVIAPHVENQQDSYLQDVVAAAVAASTKESTAEPKDLQTLDECSKDSEELDIEATLELHESKF